MGLFSKKKKDTSVNPFDLDWGAITPDGYDADQNKALYVFNHDFLSEESRTFSRVFASGRLSWYTNHLPEGCRNELLLDIRGQDEVSFESQYIKEWKEGIIKNNKQVSEQGNFVAEFLI